MCSTFYVNPPLMKDHGKLRSPGLSLDRISWRTKICVWYVHPCFCFDSLCHNWWIVYLTFDIDICTSSFSSQCPSSAGNSSDRWKPEQHFHKHLLGPPATWSPERHHPRVQGWSQHVSMDSHLSHTKRKASLIFVLSVSDLVSWEWDAFPC